MLTQTTRNQFGLVLNAFHFLHFFVLLLNIPQLVERQALSLLFGYHDSYLSFVSFDGFLALSKGSHCLNLILECPKLGQHLGRSRSALLPSFLPMGGLEASAVQLVY